jgi:hypothetical protein
MGEVMDTQVPMWVLTSQGVQLWVLDRAGSDEAEVLTLRAADGREWAATGEELFRALVALRVQVEPGGIRLCAQRCQAGRVFVPPGPFDGGR